MTEPDTDIKKRKNHWFCSWVLVPCLTFVAAVSPHGNTTFAFFLGGSTSPTPDGIYRCCSILSLWKWRRTCLSSSWPWDSMINASYNRSRLKFEYWLASYHVSEATYPQSSDRKMHRRRYPLQHRFVPLSVLQELAAAAVSPSCKVCKRFVA